MGLGRGVSKRGCSSVSRLFIFNKIDMFLTLSHKNTQFSKEKFSVAAKLYYLHMFIYTSADVKI